MPDQEDARRQPPRPAPCEGDTGRVARAAHESEREHAEPRGVDAGGDPVPGLPDVGWQEEKRPEHDEETVTRQPDESGTRIEESPPHRSRLEGRLEAALRRPRSARAGRRSRAEGDNQDAARVDGDRPLPAARGRALARVPARRSMKNAPVRRTEEARCTQDAARRKEPHSTLNAKPPSVTSASIESTRHLTR